MKIVLGGEGAMAANHAKALAAIDGIEIVSLAGGIEADAEAFAARFGIPHVSLDLEECLAQPGVEAVILTTPTQVHAKQSIQALRAGMHVLVEIPMADTLADARAIADEADAADRVAMVCHTRRFNPSHQWIQRRIAAGELHLQHLIAHTVFFRRENLNALGQPRTWTDHLLWHHACHTVDIFAHQTGEAPSHRFALQGPKHPELGIAMDMSIGLATPSGALCSLALSFNHDGPFGTTFRYICDEGTYVAEYDDLHDGHGNKIDVSDLDVSTNGFELQDREFFAAIAEGREPRASVRACLPVMETLDELEGLLGDKR